MDVEQAPELQSDSVATRVVLLQSDSAEELHEVAQSDLLAVVGVVLQAAPKVKAATAARANIGVWGFISTALAG
ncbi:MAG: hypothetical protein AAF078_08170 [Planctomycetota bacterium]